MGDRRLGPDEILQEGDYYFFKGVKLYTTNFGVAVKTTHNSRPYYRPTDQVNQPTHYNQGSVECIDAIASMLGPEKFSGYLQGNAMKYLWRCDYKGNKAQDLQKAVWYINKLLEENSNEDE